MEGGERGMKVKEMDDRFILVTDSQDIEQISVSCGVNPLSFGCLFVEVLDGEYGEIWGCYSNIPKLEYELEKIK